MASIGVIFGYCRIVSEVFLLSVIFSFFKISHFYFKQDNRRYRVGGCDDKADPQYGKFPTG
jgi:hypothetical protein